MNCSARAWGMINRRHLRRRWASRLPGSGDTASKYVARRETPLYIPENRTQ
ncbi:MAG: hypothetical protein IPM55_21750 [Acidobacteria bacterium]|nr:hypothetical protein [Acidobacteriota bacterium]